MERSRYIRTVGKSLILFFFVAGIAKISQILFVDNMFGEDYLGVRALNAFFMIFLFLIFESSVFAFNIHHAGVKEEFLKRGENGSFVSNVKAIFLSIDFYLEFALIVILSLLLPVSFVYDCVGKTFFEGLELNALQNKLYTLLIVFPVLFLLSFVAHLSVRNHWLRENAEKDKKSKTEFSKVLKSIATVVIVYCVASVGLPWILPFFITLWNVGTQGLVFVWIAVVLIGGELLYVAVCCVRAVWKRKLFIAKLKAYCKANSLYISEIKKPYLSIFFQRQGFDFSIQKNEKKYDCKFLASIFRNSAMVFSDEGNGILQHSIRVFRQELFQFMTRLDYGFESDGKKILIVLPIPLNIYASVSKSNPLIADVGEKVGTYTVYNASGFLGALERDCL